MRMERVGALVFLVALGCGCAGEADRGAERSSEPVQPGPEQVAREFLAQLERNDAKAALALVAVNEQIPPEAVASMTEDLERIAGLASGGTWHTSIVEHRQDGVAAVVIANEDLKEAKPTTDYDPWYLLKTSQGWRLLPTLTSHEVAHAFVDEKSFAPFERLSQWFETRKAELKAHK